MSPKWSLSSKGLHRNIYAFVTSHACYMPHPSHLDSTALIILMESTNYEGLQYEFSSVSLHFVSLGPKYCLQQPVLK
jgi:hypothetical protein